MLTWIGIDLNAKVDKEDMSSAASSNTDYTTSMQGEGGEGLVGHLHGERDHCVGKHPCHRRVLHPT